eukprot:217802-Alexandrium_andersonii.AAC.1
MTSSKSGKRGERQALLRHCVELVGGGKPAGLNTACMRASACRIGRPSGSPPVSRRIATAGKAA